MPALVGCENAVSGPPRVVRTSQPPAATSSKQGEWYFSVPKTDDSNRTVPVSEDLKQLLLTHRRKQLEARLKATNYTDNNLVFAMSDGRPVLHRTLARRHFKPILERAGLPATVRPYDLRLTAFSTRIANGDDAKTLSEIAGHASVRFTLDNYVNSDSDLKKNSSEKFAKTLYR